ncbi:hypothetical protein GHT06_010397 [Daphnia sinensis]|uniref:Uncharacterized protein n=1 Tax=Daphnia sinensis TaxID=1820382 RepID=A0AAD5KYC7_9CRUS|nr:hypothetical protein GHT06_010397 [Daphnia sinensis]
MVDATFFKNSYKSLASVNITICVSFDALHENHATRHSKVLPETVLPICNGNLLNHKEFHYEKEANGFFDTRRLMSTAGACRLRQYVAGDAVTCFDGISSDRKRLPQKNMLAPSMLIDNRHEELHFVFMGDSRIRQQFFNFIQLIPDYDKKSFPRRIPTFHPKIDMEVTSNILGVRVSFKWRPLLNNNVTETIRHWATGLNPLERPYFILLSMTAWHMLRKHGADYQLYQEKLIKLSPLLGQLANVSHVIWLHQLPYDRFLCTQWGGQHRCFFGENSRLQQNNSTNLGL